MKRVLFLALNVLSDTAFAEKEGFLVLKMLVRDETLLTTNSNKSLRSHLPAIFVLSE